MDSGTSGNVDATAMATDGRAHLSPDGCPRSGLAPAGASYPNVQRHGFRVVYTRTTVAARRSTVVTAVESLRGALEGVESR